MELKLLEKKAREEAIPLMQKEGMDFICAYLHDHPEVLHILEAGTAIGWSAICMAKVRENILIDTLEINRDRYEQAVSHVKEAGMEDRIFCHHVDALNYRTVKYYDLFFIDAAKSQYQRIVRHFLSYGYMGSIWIFDNLNFHGMVDNPALSENRSTKQMVHKIYQFRTWLAGSEMFSTTFYPEVGDGIAIAEQIKSNNIKGV